MAKSLGQIHTVNHQLVINDGEEGGLYQLEMSQPLTQQLGHMVRSGNSFKCVGIDVSIDPTVDPLLQGSGAVSGVLRYYNPTRGRVMAWKAGFNAVKRAMKIQGISTSRNNQYDFRVPLKSRGVYENAADFVNVACQGNDSDSELVLGLAATLLPGYSNNRSLFDVHNQAIVPSADATTEFYSGFSLMFNQEDGTPSDYVSNEATFWNGQKDSASLEMEEIHFQLAYDADESTLTYQFRPDPALYVSIMCGLFEFELLETTGAAPKALNFDFHIAGWKSLLGGKKKRSRRGRKSKRRTRRK